MRGRRPIEGPGKEDRVRIGIQEDFVRVEAVQLEAALRRGPGDRIGIEASAAKVGLRNPAMPDSAGFVLEVIEPIGENRVDDVPFFIEQQRDALRMFGIESEVISLRRFDPGYAERSGASLHGSPVRHRPFSF
jgi:hypothetical protein